MKKCKEEIAKAIIERFNDEKIVHLREVAQTFGYNHLPRHDAMDIMLKAKNRTENSKIVIFCDSEKTKEKTSFFCGAALINADLEFDGGEEYA